MVRSTGLWRAVLKRSRADWPVVLAAWLLLMCATTLLATGALYSDTVAAGGIRRSILEAPPRDRLILARTTTARPDEVESLRAPVQSAIAASIARTGGDVSTVLRSGSFAEAGIPSEAVDRLTVLAAHEDLTSHGELIDGRWPVPGGSAIEAVLSGPAAQALRVELGDRLALVSRLDDAVTVEVEVVGRWRADATDPYWAADAIELAGVLPSDPFTAVGPVIVPAQDLLAIPGRLEVEWRALPAIDRLGADDVEVLRADVELLDERLRASLPRGRQISVQAPLPDLLADVGRSIVVSRSGVTLLTIQFAVLAGYAIVLVGGLLLERRRTETALVRSRGGSSADLLLMAVVEGVVLAIVAVVVAPFLAVLIVRTLAELGPLGQAGVAGRAEITPGALVVAGVAGLAGIVALALPTLGSSISLGGVRAAIGRQTARTLPQRIGVDLALVVLAVVAIWQLRLYGAPLTRNARGVLGVDPLLVAAPAIGLLGGAVLALRIVPRLAEVGERLLERRRGLVAPLGGRQLARRPLRYTRAALLLMLAAGLATFATSHAATWTRSQSDQADYQAAADIRVTPPDDQPVPGVLTGAAHRELEGVLAAMPVTRRTIDLGRNVRGGPLLALDPASAASIVRLPAGGPTIDEALGRLAADRPASGGLAIPGRPVRLSIVVDAALTSLGFEEPYAGELAPDARGIRPQLVVADADGRIHRLVGEPGLFDGHGQRLVVDVATSAPAGLPGEPVPAWPFTLVAVELAVAAPAGVAIGGTIDLVQVEASGSPDGQDWSVLPVVPDEDPWRWLRAGAGAATPLEPPPGQPARIDLGTPTDPTAVVFPEEPATFRLLSLPREAERAPVVVARRFADLTGSRVGEELTATTFGIRLPIRIAAIVPEFPSLDPAQPFVILERAVLERNRYALTGQVAAPDEWWLAVESGHSGDVAARLTGAPFESDAVIDREALARSLSTDPVSLGIIGALGLGAVAAMVFAAIGFVVSTTVSTTERVGEFALLRALGLSGRQLAVWLSVESAFLLVVGIVAGTALGVLLAWLVLPFATLTATGAPAVPTPTVVVPWQSIVPTWLLAVGLLGVTIVIVRRQLPSVRISGVLRARDE